MFGLFVVFTMFVCVLAPLCASIYSLARMWAARRACYRRAALGSLVCSARRSAIVRHFGRV